MPSARAAGVFSAKVTMSYFVRLIFRAHTSGRINSVISLPFKSIWCGAFMKDIPVKEDDDVYFIFIEGERISYIGDCLRYFRRKYRRSKLIYYLENPMMGPHACLVEYWHKISRFYDAGITHLRSDAEKHGLLFTDYRPCLLSEKEYQPENASDVFFIGQAKDRLAKILAVYERLTGAGLKCDFWITGVPKSQQKYSGDIHYKTESSYKWMSYDEILQRSRNTKCILEITPFNQNYSTLRFFEALWYHKKLLTTNLDAPRGWFYDPEIVRVFKDASDIDPEFITKPLTPEDEHRIFDGVNIGDFNIFADFLIKNVHRKES